MSKIIAGGNYVAVITRDKLYVWCATGPCKLCLTAKRNDEHDSKKEAGNSDQTLEKSSMAVAISAKGSYIGACFDDKKLMVWDTETWKKAERQVIKRPTSLAFTNDEKNLLIADKAGDVYRYVIGDDAVDATPIVGHLSMILDLKITHDDRHIITADRDEKIRISHFPNGYNIERFCLGHTNFVSSTDLVPGRPHLLISGGGDGTLRMWNKTTGDELHCADISDALDEEGEQVILSIAVSKCGQMVCIVVERLFAVLVYKINESSLSFDSSIGLTGSPVSICFDSNGGLFILSSDSTAPITCYGRDSKTQEFTLRPMPFAVSQEDAKEICEGLAVNQMRLPEIRKHGKRMDLENIAECVPTHMRKTDNDAGSEEKRPKMEA